MAKKVVVEEQYDHETGEVREVEVPQVDMAEVAKSLEELRAADTGKRFEWPDPRPLSPPLGYQPEPSLAERIRMMVRSEHLRFAAMESGMETFEEADDFDVDDDFDPTSPYEMFFDQPVVSAEAHPSGQAQPVGEPERGGGGAQPPSGEQSGAPVGGSPGAAAPPSGKP